MSKSFLVAFDNEGRVYRVCDATPGETWRSENYLRKIFGEPSYISINSDATRKAITFSEWNQAFVIEKGQIATHCITKLSITYLDEYEGPVE